MKHLINSSLTAMTAVSKPILKKNWILIQEIDITNLVVMFRFLVMQIIFSVTHVGISVCPKRILWSTGRRKATLSMKIKFVGSAMTTLKRLTTNRQHLSLNVFRDISYHRKTNHSQIVSKCRDYQHGMLVQSWGSQLC